MANKNSTYVKSLVSYILDTKPYHSKLSEIGEQYRFSDNLNVKISENLFNSLVMKGAFVHSHFANGSSVPAPRTNLQNFFTPLFRNPSINNQALTRGAFKINRDENTDLPLVPMVFDPKVLGAGGLADAAIQKNGNTNKTVYLLEGKDVHQSKGAYVFGIDSVHSDKHDINFTFELNFTEFVAPDFVQPEIYPKTFNTGVVSSDLVITGPAEKIDNSSFLVTGPGLVKVIGLQNGFKYAPRISAIKNKNLLQTVTDNIRTQLISDNPGSTISQIRAIINNIGAILVLNPDSASSIALDQINTILSNDIIPSNYITLINALNIAPVPVISGFSTWDDVLVKLVSLSPRLYYGGYTDASITESGELQYRSVHSNNLSITNVIPNIHTTDYEEYTFTVLDTANTVSIHGSSSGLIGFADVPSVFTSSKISCNVDNRTLFLPDVVTLGETYTILSLGSGTDFVSMGATSGTIGETFVCTARASGTGVLYQEHTLTAGTTILLTPMPRIVVHEDAALEKWSLIRTNPIAYSRPEFISTRYGYIIDASGAQNKITVLNPALGTSTITLTCTANSVFTISSSVDPDYTGTVHVGTEFNDGELQFTVITGSVQPFKINDEFIINIKNPDPVISEFDIYYGYDAEPFADDLVRYNTISSTVQDYLRTLDFGYDSRFAGFDKNAFGLTLNVSADTGEYRLVPIPNLTKPLLLQNSVPTNQVNTIASEDSENPDAASVLTGIDGSIIELFYADSFSIQHKIGSTWVERAIVNVDTPYSDAEISFVVPTLDKPYISAVCTTGSDVVISGDTFYWYIQNEAPSVISARYSSNSVPRLIMHAGGFHAAIDAKFEVKALTGSNYSVQGVHTSGVNNGEPVFSTPIVVTYSSTVQSFKNEEFGLHFTLLPGKSGFLGTDKFVFETFNKKPMILVHGSVSGWMPDAEYDKYYWNGKIGFKIKSPVLKLFENSTQISGSPWSTSSGTVQVLSVLANAASANYEIKCHKAGHWMLYKNGVLQSTGVTILKSQDIVLSMPTAIPGTTLVLQVLQDSIDFDLCNDLSIVRTDVYTGTSNDFVLLSKTRDDNILLSIKPVNPDHGVVLDDLAPNSIDIRSINHSTQSGVPLKNTSPETDILTGFVPIIKTNFAADSNLTNFSDGTSTVQFHSASSGEYIGSIKNANTLSVGTFFEWDSAFAAKYLVLNTETAFIHLGSGTNENVRVNISDTAIFFNGIGSEFNGFGFTENLNVSIQDTLLLKIRLNTLGQSDTGLYYKSGLPILPSVLALAPTDTGYVPPSNRYSYNESDWNETFVVEATDGPFNGFLPGYDNLAYDEDDVLDGDYDLGLPLTSHFEQAKELAAKSALTVIEQAQLNSLLSALNPFLYNNDILGTTLDWFLNGNGIAPSDPGYVPNVDNGINNSPLANSNISGVFGTPKAGLAISTQESTSQNASTSIADTAILLSLFSGTPFDNTGFDSTRMDEVQDSLSSILGNNVIPTPSTGLPSVGTLYTDFVTTLYTEVPTQNVEIQFSSDLTVLPTFYYWLPTEPMPYIVPTPIKKSNKSVQLNFPFKSEMKIIII